MNLSNLKVENGVATLVGVTMQAEVCELAEYAKENHIEKYVAVTGSGAHYAMVEGKAEQIAPKDFGIGFKSENLKCEQQVAVSQSVGNETHSIDKVDILFSELKDEIIRCAVEQIHMDYNQLREENKNLLDKLKAVQSVL